MTRRLWLAVAGGAVCLALASGFALLAADVRAWQQAFATGDLQYRAAPGGARPWESPDSLPWRPAARLLDVGDDVTFRRAVRLYQLSTDTAFVDGFGSSPRPLESTRRLFLRIERGDGDPRARSRAANFLAVMTYNSGAFIDESFTRRAARLLRRAVMLDTRNEEAKFNLELMMYTSPESAQQGQSGGAGGRAQPDAGGAGSTPPGRGY